MRLEQVLEALACDANVLLRLKSAIRKRGWRGDNLDKTLNSYGLRNSYRDAVRTAEQQRRRHGGRWLKDPARLAYILRKMDISVDELIERCPFPFSDWPPGSRVLIVLGTRCGRLAVEYDEAASFDGVSAADDQARSFVEDQLHDSLRCKIDVQRYSADMSISEVNSYIGRWFDDRFYHQNRNRELIIVIGAPPTNPMAEPFARKILNGLPSPYQFRWGPSFDMERFQKHDIVLSHPENCRIQDEGLAIPSGRTNALYRRRPNVAPETYGSSASQSRDCGLLMMNLSREGIPRLILLAGHGGSGTVATAFALFSDALQQNLVQYEAAPQVQYALIEAKAAHDKLKLDGDKRGWTIYKDPLRNSNRGDDDEDYDIRVSRNTLTAGRPPQRRLQSRNSRGQ